MKRSIWVIFAIFVSICLPGRAQHSSYSRVDKKHEAVNSYIRFTNESIHLLWDLHVKLEQFNKDANRYQQGEISQLSFDTENLIQDFIFNSELKSVCATKPADTGVRVDLKDLYEKTSVGNGYIPLAQRMIMNDYRDELYFSLIRVLGLADSLSQYVKIGQYKIEPKLDRAYEILRELSKTYSLLQIQKENLERICKQLSQPIPPALKSLQNIMTFSREIVVSVRKNAPAKIPVLIKKLELAVAQAERQKENPKENLFGLAVYYKDESSGYSHMITYADHIQTRAQEFISKDDFSDNYEAYGKAYYYYNERMLAVFNHHKYGIAAYYNRFISFGHRVFVIEVEEVPLFKVIPPSEKKPATPEFTVNSLDGAASNNMVFLLDVSASMDRPEKLSLLKKSMSELVSVLRPQDEISLVIYSGDARVILNPTSALFKAEITSAIKSMRPGGKTKALQGLKEAYRVAERNFIPDGNNRIIMASDGAFDVSDSILKYVGRKSMSSIQLSVLLFNKLENNKVAERLNELATRGGGRYSHIQPQNATRVLVNEANSVGAVRQ